jgi:peroxiredoxin (alkyl hydroperoxide reductase subunit C)
MKQLFSFLFAAAVLAGCAQTQQPVVQVQQEVPNFSVEALMPDDSIQTIELNDYKDKWKLVFFYPKDFTFVCPTELRELAEYKQEFEDLGVVVMAASVDSAESHKKWRPDLVSETGEVFDFVWLADESRDLAKMFGIYDVNHDVALRGAFIISPEDNVLQGSIITNENVGRSSTELIRMIQANQTGSLCPASWHPGDAVIEPTEEEQAAVDAL